MRKNLLKSILFLVLSFLMAVSFAGCDCKGCNKEEGPSTSTIDLYFSSDEINLTIDDSRRLDVFVDGVMQNPADVKFGSENPNVVTINDAGEVTGYAPGSTYVTASMQGATAKCMVNVDLMGLAPEIVFINADYAKYDQIAIPLGDELDMAANISFNGKIFDDAEFSYELSDRTLGSVSGTKFTANKSAGELQISVIAKWRGVTVEEKVGHVPTDYYSKGYQNLFEICKRFALTDVLFTGEKPFIILDDPFYNLDDEKLKNALELIQKLSNEYQIVYFICHESRRVKLET